MTMRALLLRGMLVGLVSAALALVFAWIFGEPQVSLAIAFEGHHAHEAAAAEPETVSRIVQRLGRPATKRPGDSDSRHRLTRTPHPSPRNPGAQQHPNAA